MLAGRLVLVAVVVLLAVRLVGFMWDFGQQSLQMDFAAYYTAGESVAAGLDPYRNHVTREPPIWDGRCGFRHSRFLYPPLVAVAFTPVAQFSYHTAKWLWMIGSLAALAGALAVVFWALGTRPGVDRLLVTAAVVLGFYPLLTLLERGQIDAHTLLLFCCGAALLTRGRQPLLAGGLLAFATVLKLPLILVVVFLLWRRRWQALAGFFLGGVVVVLLSVVFAGVGLSRGYLVDELPRISRYGEAGTGTMRLPASAFVDARRGVPHDKTTKGGRIYDDSALEFVPGASLVRTPAGRAVAEFQARLGVAPSPARVSLLMLFLLLGIVWIWIPLRRADAVAGRPKGLDEMAFWQIAAVAILLIGPLTWVMNTVWLLALIPVGMEYFDELHGRRGLRSGLPVALGGLGLLIAALPDPVGFPMVTPFDGSWWAYKYVAAEVLLLSALADLLRQRADGEAGPCRGRSGRR